MVFQWSASMSVGVPELDADHRCLVRIVNLLEDARGSDAGRIIETVLDTLGVYCRFHFDREERVMARCGFPAVATHRAEHRSFSETTARWWDKRRKKPSETVARELREFLTNWLCHHILIQDMAYKPYVTKAGNVGAVVSTGPSPLRCHSADVVSADNI
jgi:hemerythrin